MTPKSHKRKLAPSATTKPSKPKIATANGSSGEVKLESTARASTGWWADGADRTISSHERLIKVATDPPKRRVDLDEKSRALSIEFYKLIRTGQAKKAMEFANTVDATALDLSSRMITEAATGQTTSVLAAFLLFAPWDGSEDSTERDELLLSFMLSAGANDLTRPTITSALYWALWRNDVLSFLSPINRMRCVLDVMEAAPDRHGLTYFHENAIGNLIERAQHPTFTAGGENSIIGRIIRLMIKYAENTPTHQSWVLQCLNSVIIQVCQKWRFVERNLVLATRGDLQRMLIGMSPVIEIDGYLKDQQNPWFIESCFHGEEGGVPEYVTAAVQQMAEYRMRRDALVRSLLADSLPRELFPIIDAYGARPLRPATDFHR